MWRHDYKKGASSCEFKVKKSKIYISLKLLNKSCEMVRSYALNKLFTQLKHRMRAAS